VQRVGLRASRSDGCWRVLHLKTDGWTTTMMSNESSREGTATAEDTAELEIETGDDCVDSSSFAELKPLKAPNGDFWYREEDLAFKRKKVPRRSYVYRYGVVLYNPKLKKFKWRCELCYQARKHWHLIITTSVPHIEDHLRKVHQVKEGVQIAKTSGRTLLTIGKIVEAGSQMRVRLYWTTGRTTKAPPRQILRDAMWSPFSR
jgi:hypothetical protein